MPSSLPPDPYLLDLQAQGLLPPAQAAAIAAADQARPFSLHYELRALLYLGTTLMGLLALAFSIFTLRYYRSLLPPEVAAVLAGAVLISSHAKVTVYFWPTSIKTCSMRSSRVRSVW